MCIHCVCCTPGNDLRTRYTSCTCCALKLRKVSSSLCLRRCSIHFDTSYNGPQSPPNYTLHTCQLLHRIAELSLSAVVKPWQHSQLPRQPRDHLFQRLLTPDAFGWWPHWLLWYCRLLCTRSIAVHLIRLDPCSRNSRRKTTSPIRPFFQEQSDLFLLHKRIICNRG